MRNTLDKGIDLNMNAKKIDFYKILLLAIMTVLLLVFFTYLVLIGNNERSAKKTGEVMLNQMCGVLAENQSAEETLLESLKEEYIIRAKTVAYILGHHPEAEYDIEELCKIAQLMSIDEIHLFDETGIIYAGTRPKYYGYSFDSGEQINYFKPMLEDKSLSMCQDVTPNTAEGKSMMYAITWDSSGSRMIQVGIEPVRLLEELKTNQISNVVDNMPVYENLEIYVADAATGVILGATQHKPGEPLRAVGIEVSDLPLQKITHFRGMVDGQRSICSALRDEQYDICVVQNRKTLRTNALFSTLIVLGYLLGAAAILLWVVRHLIMIKREQMEQLEILTSMSEIYYSMHLLDLQNNTVSAYTAQNQVKDIVESDTGTDAVNAMREIMHATMTDEYLERGLEFTDLLTLAERLKGKKILSMDLLGKNVGWIRMSFVSISTDADGCPTKVICTTQIIDEEKRKEELLIRESITDKLTQCFNRRAYENDLRLYPDTPQEEDFVFISMDVNGLKNVNDSLGHAAGDELLLGASECMKRCFGSSGKVYRMGGDEFVAMIFANEDRLAEMKADFEETVRNWSGEAADSLSVSCGYVAKREFPTSTVAQMAKIADARMYEAKELYYREHKDRRRK